jgi:cytochrome P450
MPSHQLGFDHRGAFQMPPNYPDDVIRIESFSEAIEILRRADVFRVEPLGREAPLREGTLLKIDGELHMKRRRVANRLIRREWHERYRHETLVPTVARRVENLLANPDGDGIVRTDLVLFSRRLFLDMAATLTGIRVGSEEDGDLLASLVEPMHSGSVVKWFHNQDQVMARAVDAMKTFRDHFFRPALAQHLQLVERVEEGELNQEDLPNDLMTLIALRADPAWSDEGLALRTVIFYLGGASNTHVRPLGFAVDELDRWLKVHPEDALLTTEPTFLQGVVVETLRMYANTPAIFRVASEDLQLAVSGRQVHKGQYVAIDSRLTGRDKATYGPDADQFNPRRAVPDGAYPFGVAFGTGDHMCQGMPIVLGAGEIQGTLSYVLRTLLAAGMERDPSREAVKVPERDSYEFYPVRFVAALVRQSPEGATVNPQ